jgi:hypothetical protein
LVFRQPTDFPDEALIQKLPTWRLRQKSATPEPPSDGAAAVTSVPVADGICRIDQGGTTVVEFKDHITLFELDANPAQAKAIIAYSRRPESALRS